MFATVLRRAANLLLAVFALGIYVVPAVTHDAPFASDYYTNSPIAAAQYQALNDAKGVNVPEWTPALAQAFPGCEAQREGVLYPHVVIVDEQADAHRWTFDRAWAEATDGDHADVWFVGGCP